MGRPPEVFVRPVTMGEGRRLQRISRTARDPVKLRRAIVVLMSAQGQSVPDIAHLLDCSPEYVRGVIHAFNESGFAVLDPKWSGGRPKTISEPVRRQICRIARCCPRGQSPQPYQVVPAVAHSGDRARQSGRAASLLEAARDGARISPINFRCRGVKLCFPPAALCLSAETGVERVARQGHDLLPAQVHPSAGSSEVGVDIAVEVGRVVAVDCGFQTFRQHRGQYMFSKRADCAQRHV